MGIFQGHQVFSIYWNIFLAFAWIVVFLILKRFKKLPHLGRRMGILDILITLAFALFIPNSAYLFFEAKHFVIAPYILASVNDWTYLVYGSVSLLGFLATVFGTRMITNYYAKTGRQRLRYNFSLSSISSLGAVAGILNLNSWEILRLDKILNIAERFFARPQFIIVALASTLLFFGLNLLLDHFQKPA